LRYSRDIRAARSILANIDDHSDDGEAVLNDGSVPNWLRQWLSPPFTLHRGRGLREAVTVHAAPTVGACIMEFV